MVPCGMRAQFHANQLINEKSLWDSSSSVKVRCCRRHGMIYLVPETLHFTSALYEIWHACYWCSNLPVLSIVFPGLSLWHPVLDPFWAFNPLWAGVVISLLSRRVISSHVWVVSGHVIILPLQRSWKRGILVSPCPSIRPSVRLCTESCPLCIFHNTGRIHSFLHISSTYFIFSKINSPRKWLTYTALCGHGIMGW